MAPKAPAGPRIKPMNNPGRDYGKAPAAPPMPPTVLPGMNPF